MKLIHKSPRRSPVGSLTAFVFALAIGMLTTTFGTAPKAAPVTVDLIGTVIAAIDPNTGAFFDSTFNGTVGNGTVTFDDSFFVGGLVESQTAEQGLKISFNIFDQDFNETDDAFFPSSPELFALNGEFNILDFSVGEVDFSNDPFNVVEIDNPGVAAFAFFNLGTDNVVFDALTGAVTRFEVTIVILENNLSAVPVPAALPLFGTGLAIMGFVGWHRKRKAEAA